MKRTYILLASALVFGVAFLMAGYMDNAKGAPTSIVVGTPIASAIEGPAAVGIVLKNGSRLDEIMPLFTRTIEPCETPDPATTTPSDMCERVYYQGQEVRVYYAAPLQFVNKAFNDKLGDFPFAGRFDYVKRDDAHDIEAHFAQFIFESGNGSVTLLYEFP